VITSENNGTELWGGKFTDAARTALALGDDYVVKGDATIFFKNLPELTKPILLQVIFWNN
jgi:hypothetical protein